MKPTRTLHLRAEHMSPLLPDWPPPRLAPQLCSCCGCLRSLEQICLQKETLTPLHWEEQLYKV